MSMMTLNFALLFVFQLSTRQFCFWHRENLFHRFAEFVGRLLLGRWRHRAKYAQLFQRAIACGKLWVVPFVLLRRFDKRIRRWRIQDVSVIRSAKETIKSGRNIFTKSCSLTAHDSVTGFLK
jgi:hypothetical protein